MALLGSGDIETDQQRWRYVMTAAVVSILALALPVWRLRASEIERNRMDIELKNIQTDLEKVLADRTKELQVSNELRQATDYRFQDFAIAASDWFWEIDAERNYTFMSPAVGRSIGNEASWYIGRNHDEVVARYYDPADWRPFDDAFAARSPFRDLIFARTDDAGIRKWVRTSGVPVFSQNGDFKGFRGCSADVTDSVLSEEALRDSHQQLRLITDALPAPIFYVDAEERYRFVNKFARDWMTKSEEDVLTLAVTEVFSAETYRRLKPRIDAALSGATQDFEAEIQFPDGGIREVKVTYVPHLGPDNKVLGFFGLSMDLTETHALEEQLRQAQKMEAVGQLTGGIAHDFNNLLAVVLGNAEMLNSRTDDDTEIQNTIVRAAIKGAELTQSLLAFSRKQPLSPRNIDLAELVAGMSNILHRSLGETIELTTVSEPSLWFAMADPGQVENALLNLAINARDSMPDGGRLTINCENIQLESKNALENLDALAGDYVVLVVSDTGTGMDAETQEHAFEPFYTTKDIGAGSGLGLSMVYGFARQSDGHVEIFSEVGQGTTVKLYLPRAPENAVSAGFRDGEDTPHGRGEVVLVIEDDEDVRALTAKMLTALDYRVFEAGDAGEARRILSGDGEIDLVLSDVILPGGTSGPEFARELSDLFPGLKTVFMSGYQNPKASSGTSPDPANVLLRKPFSRQQLARTIRDAFEQD
ncbi:MAG: PAS domain-containing protein [Rhodospirillaceae bacterium]|nr:PAS domain-containing protein [Rhodospirillaceae bacterium]MBT5898024.1 PAS domain-containing protein [Rhodospirillaceae bacterium]MBT6427516.1 PAS domain-containing protein [Rhodospirillaceae bacterium]